MIRFPAFSEFRSRAEAFWAHSFTNRAVVVCILIFAAQSLNLFFSDALTLNYLLARNGFLLNFFAYGFLHGGFWHMALNMLALYFAGNAVERYNSRGNARTVFFGGIVAGGIAWFALTALAAANPASQTLVGASAGIAALFAYFSIAHRDGEIRAMIFFLIPVKMRAWLIFAILTGVSLLGLCFSEIPSLRSESGGNAMQTIAHSAHLGGLLFGAAFALADERLRNRFGNVRYFRR